MAYAVVFALMFTVIENFYGFFICARILAGFRPNYHY